MAELDQGRIVFGQGAGTPEGEIVEQIRQRAHEIWEEEGCPDGRQAEHWKRAERELRGDGPPPRQ